MRINGGVSNGIGAVRPKGDVGHLNSPSKVSGVAEMNDDVLSVSPSAEIRGRIAEVPDVRTSMLEAIQSKIDSNTYHPDSEVIIDRLLRENLQLHGGY